jgi:Xaa-Pro dipeptidase
MRYAQAVDRSFMGENCEHQEGEYATSYAVLSDHRLLNRKDLLAPSLAFPIDEYQARIERARASMRGRDLDALIIFALDNIYYLSGYDGTIGGYLYTMLLLTQSGAPTLLVHHVDLGTTLWSCWLDDIRIWRHGEAPETRALELLRERGLERAKIGLEEQAALVSTASDRALRAGLQQARFVDASDLLARMRYTLSSREIAYARESARQGDSACEAAYGVIAEGVSERDIAKAVSDSQYHEGGRWGSVFCLGSGEKSVALHSFAGERRLQRGDAVTLVPHGDKCRYVTSIHRTACVGKAPQYLRDLHAVSTEAIDRSIAAIRPGVPAGEIDRISREATRKYDHFRCHRTGFSMGIQFGYGFKCMPKLSVLEGVDEPLQAGMVLSIEPNLQDIKGRIGILLGNNYLVTETGCESLHHLPFDLFESA